MAAKITVKKLFAKTFPLMIFTTVSYAGFTAGKTGAADAAFV